MTRSSGETRRSAYGANPALGPRGQRSRQQILDAAMEVFAEVGYRDATMELIAEHTGKSRASVYQYFGSKSEIFVLLMDHVGTELLDTTRHMGALGPGRAGFENLRDWIVEYFDVCSRHTAMFLLWASSEVNDPSLYAPVARWIDAFGERIANRITEASGSVDDPRTMALAMLSIVERCAFLLYRQPFPFGELEMADSLARSIQLSIFPQSLHLFRGPDALPAPPKRPMRHFGGATGRAQAMATSARFTPELKRPVSSQGAATVQLILDAAAQVFARKGFHNTSVDDVMNEAGLSHGAVYQYWSDLTDVLHTLAAASVENTWAIVEQLENFDPTQQSANQVEEFCERLLANYERNAPTFRVWASLETSEPVLDQITADSLRAMRQTVARLLERAPLRDVLDVDPATVALITLASHFPANAVRFDNWATHAQMRATMTLCICRGFLGVRY